VCHLLTVLSTFVRGEGLEISLLLLAEIREEGCRHAFETGQIFIFTLLKNVMLNVSTKESLIIGQCVMQL